MMEKAFLEGIVFSILFSISTAFKSGIDTNIDRDLCKKYFKQMIFFYFWGEVNLMLYKTLSFPWTTLVSL